MIFNQSEVRGICTTYVAATALAARSDFGPPKRPEMMGEITKGRLEGLLVDEVFFCGLQYDRNVETYLFLI